MIIRTLDSADIDAVHVAFNEAFSDYVIPLAPPRDRLIEMLTRRGYVPSASVCAIDDGRIVAFTLNGIDGARAYDSGTGVVPTHRRRGLARRMMMRSCELVREHGCREYTLEVIDANASAIALYRNLGFRETRGLQCWGYDGAGEPARLLACPPRDWETWWDARPSWQNSTRSMSRATDDRVVIGAEDGAALLFPLTGEVAQLAVRRDARRRGIGTKLLRQARSVAGKPLRILNVDDGVPAISAFLDTCGAIRTIRQLEMSLEL